MYTLFIDTHINTNVALFKDKKLIKNFVNNDVRQSTKIMPLIEKLFNECNITSKDINEILVVNGPGSFTGVRLGVTIAKTFAYSFNIPIKTINSIELLAMLDNYSNKYYAVLDSKGAYVGVKNGNEFEISYMTKAETNDLDLTTEVSSTVANIFKYYDRFIECNPHMVKPIYIKKIEALK